MPSPRIGRVSRAKADWIVNAAAYTAVDLAEDEPARAAAINDGAVGIARGRGGSRPQPACCICRRISYSTAQSNRAYLPDDPPQPIERLRCDQARRREKGARRRMRGDRAAHRLGVCRHRKEFRAHHAEAHARAGTSEGGRRSDRHTDLGHRSSRAPSGTCSRCGAPAGIYHWTDLGVASWYDFAVAIQDEALERGLLKRAVPIVPIATAEYPTRARRPAFSVLDTSATRGVSPRRRCIGATT